MTVRATLRVLLVGGIAVLAAGIYLTREWEAPSRFAEFGLIVVLATGIFAAAVGLMGLIREEPPPDERAARRSRLLGIAAWKALLPPVVAGGLMVLFFALTNRWENLANPVASQVALVFGIVGALIGILVDRISRWELILVPLALLVGLLGFGDRLPFDSETTSNGEIVTLLSIVILLTAIVINIPQVARGRRPAGA